MNARSFILGLILLGTASAAVAAQPPCLPTVEQAWIRAAPPGATAFAGYATVRNGCGKVMSITDVAARDFAMGMIHETRVLDGVSRMRHVRQLAVLPGGVLRFEPGGTHLMLMHPRRAIRAGDKLAVRLKLDDGREVAVLFEVRSQAPGTR